MPFGIGLAGSTPLLTYQIYVFAPFQEMEEQKLYQKLRMIQDKVKKTHDGRSSSSRFPPSFFEALMLLLAVCFFSASSLLRVPALPVRRTPACRPR